MSAPIRVLLADDQQLVRSGFRLILSVEDDIEVVGEAADGAAAVEQARALEPDVILMDVQMPGTDGIEATRRITTEQIGGPGRCRVLMLTTFDRDDYLFDALEAGASGFLLKNTDADGLVDAVRSAADGHALLAPEVTLRVIERMTGGSDRGGAGGLDTPGPGSLRSQAGLLDQRGDSRAGLLDQRGDSRAGLLDQRSGSGVGMPEQRGGSGVEMPAQLALLTEREREVLLLLGEGLSNAEIAARLYLGEATVKTHVSNCLAKLQLRDRVQAVVWVHRHRLLPEGE